MYVTAVYPSPVLSAKAMSNASMVPAREASLIFAPVKETPTLLRVAMHSPMLAPPKTNVCLNAMGRYVEPMVAEEAAAVVRRAPFAPWKDYANA